MGAVTKEQVEAVRASFGRALTKGDLMSVFYTSFLASDPQIAQKFAKTDMTKQMDLFRQGINLAIMFGNGNILGKNAMDRLRMTHSHKNLDINPRLYPKWKATFMAAVESLDPNFDQTIAQAWDAVLQNAINHIQGGYEE